MGAHGCLCISNGVLWSLHKLESARDTWATIDECYHSRGESGALGRVKAAFSCQYNIYPKRKKGGLEKKKTNVFDSDISQASPSQFCKYSWRIFDVEKGLG